MSTSKPRTARWWRMCYRCWWPWVGLAAGLLITLALWGAFRRSDHEDLELRQQAQAKLLQDRLSRRMESLQYLLTGCASYLGRGPLPSRSEWHDYAASLGLERSYAGVQGLSFAEWVPRAALPAHLRRMRAGGLPEYGITPGGSLPPDPVGLSAVVYVEPLNEANKQVIGRDVWADPVRREAKIRARDSGKPALSGKILLYHADSDHPLVGLVLYAPVYRGGRAPKSVAQRQQELLGWTTFILRMQDFMQGLLEQEGFQMDVELYDGSNLDPAQRLFDRDPSFTTGLGGNPIDRTLQVGGRTWTLRMQEKPGHATGLQPIPRWGILAGGGLASLLFFAFLASLAGSEQRAQVLARHREGQLLASEAQFFAAFERAPLGMAVVDSQSGVYLAVNPAFHRMLGYGEGELTGRNLLDLTHPDFRDSARSSMGVLAAGDAKGYEKEKQYLHRDGHPVTVRLQVAPLPPGPEDGRRRHLSIMEDVTATRASERALKESEARFRVVAEQGPAALFMHRGGRFVYLNPASLRLLGASQVEELMGQPILERVHPEDRERVRERVRGALEEGRDVPRAHLRMLRLDGATVEVEVDSRPVTYQGEPTMLVFTQDVGERKRAEAALLESELRLRSLLDNAPDAIFLHDLDGRFLECNAAACESTGYTREEILRMRVSDLEDGFQEDRAVDAWKRLGQGESAILPGHHHRKDGSVFPVEVHLSILGGEGPRRTMAIVRDLSDRERSQDAEFRARKAESLVLMAGGIAHDFNNIFQALQTTLEMADYLPGVGPDLRRTLERGKAILKKAVSLSWKMLDFSGRGFLRLADLDLEKMLRDLQPDFQTLLGPGFALELQTEAVPRVEGDPGKLTQVFRSLVENAKEAAGEGGTVRIRLSVDFGEDPVGPRFPGIWPLTRPQTPATVCLEFSDEGPGVLPEHLSLLCDPFFTTKEQGRGLGLAAAVGILSSHRAGLHILNGDGRGLVLRIHFPPVGL